MFVQRLPALSLTNMVSLLLPLSATNATKRSLALVLTGTLREVTPELAVF